MKTTNDRISSNNNNTNSTTTMVDNLVEKFSILSNLLAPTWLLSIINRTSEEETDKTQQQEINCCGDSLLKFKRLGRTTTDIIVQCVVLFKQSPIPGTVLSDIYLYTADQTLIELSKQVYCIWSFHISYIYFYGSIKISKWLKKFKMSVSPVSRNFYKQMKNIIYMNLHLKHSIHLFQHL